MKKRILILSLTVLGITLCGYGFCFGPLFPWSPLKPGFESSTFGRAIAWYPKGSEPLPEFAALESLMKETEKSHKLRFRKGIRVILCANGNQYKRFSMIGGHASAGPTGTVIYINPSIRSTTYPPPLDSKNGDDEKAAKNQGARRDIASFLRHELSHAILYQNTSLFKALKIKNWVEEGLAVYTGNPDHYYRGAEFRTLAFDRGYFFNLLNDKSEPPSISKEIKFYFVYGAYGEFMAYLIQNHGMDTVLDFIHAYIYAPSEEECLFRLFFGCEPEIMLERFARDQKNDLPL